MLLDKDSLRVYNLATMTFLVLYLIAAVVSYVIFADKRDQSTAIVFAIIFPFAIPFVILPALIVIPYTWVVKLFSR